MEPKHPIEEVEKIDHIEQERELSSGERFSSDLDSINSVIIGMLKDKNTDPADLRQAWTVRAMLVEGFIDSLESRQDSSSPRARVQFDIMVDTAIIFETTGDVIKYLEELDAAEAFALGSNIHEVVDSIAEELDKKIDELELTQETLILKLRGTIEFSKRNYLHRLLAEGIDYDDFVAAIHKMILDEGGDPNEVLARLGVTA